MVSSTFHLQARCPHTIQARVGGGEGASATVNGGSSWLVSCSENVASGAASPSSFISTSALLLLSLSCLHGAKQDDKCVNGLKSQDTTFAQGLLDQLHGIPRPILMQKGTRRPAHPGRQIQERFQIGRLAVLESRER